MSFVFVYGTLKTGHSNHHYLANSTRIGTARTALKNYVMFDYGFPVVMRAYREPSGHITGEAYRVNMETLRCLDALEGEGEMYRRVLTPVLIREHSGWNRFENVYMYEGMPTFFDRKTLEPFDRVEGAYTYLAAKRRYA